MNNFEFISYKALPEDQWTLGIATVRAYGKVILKYKHVRKKDGATFFCPHQMNVTENGEKTNVPSFLLDSRSDEEIVIELIKGCVKQLNTSTPPKTQESYYNAVATPRNSNLSYSQSGGELQEQQLPF